MKRKLALLLAGCLTISPLSVGIPAITSYAAEAGSESEFLQLDESSVEVKDENGTVLTAVGDNSTAAQGSYTLTAGETRQLSVFFEQGPDSPVLSAWSSETPQVIDVDDEGFLTALSAGTGRITLSLTTDAEQAPLLVQFDILVNDPAAEAAPVQDTSAGEETVEEPA